MLRESSRLVGVMSSAVLTPAEQPPLFLLQGDMVSLHFACQTPVKWSAQEHAETKVMVLFAPAICRLQWQGDDMTWKETTLRGPAVCVIPSRLSHVPIWEREAELLLIYLRPILFKRLPGGVQALGALCEPTVFAADNLFVWQMLSSLRHLLRLHIKPGKPYLNAIGLIAASHLIWRLSATPVSNGTTTTLSREKLRVITDYIQAHLARPTRVQDLARKAGLSRAHFSEVFKNTTGTSPYEYITRCRVLRAQDLLATGEHRISEVAEAAGFCDQSHLNRHFKKLLGYSPKTMATQARDSRHPF